MNGDGMDGGFVDLAGPPPPLVIVPTLLDGPFRGDPEIPPPLVAVAASNTSTLTGRGGRGPPPRTDGAVSISVHLPSGYPIGFLFIHSKPTPTPLTLLLF